MGSVDRVDDRTFSVNFTGDGAEKLKNKVNERLKEFMGDYTDDALVEYVIVLLKNGRCKEEAKNELNVFLGDDSDTFVSWLWDHLATNIGSYVKSEEPCLDEVVIESNSSGKLDSESHAGKPKRESKSRNKREWKGLVRDASDPPIRNSEIENTPIDERSQSRVRLTRRSPSPRRTDRKKRNRNNGERWESKRETTQVNNGATRRLLQFAVRDAVSMSRPSSNTTSEPSLKRLRSVVSTPNGDSSLVEPPRRIKSIARVPNAMATVIKAVAEAAEDTARVKSSVSVFDRLGRGGNLSRPYDLDENAMEDSQYGDVNQVHRRKQSMFLQRRGNGGQYVGDMTTVDNDSEFISDYASENEGYDNTNVVHRRGAVVSHTRISGENNGDSSMMMDYSIDDKTSGDMTRRPRQNEDLDQPAVAPNTSRKIVNISVNVNTWKPSHYKEQRDSAEKSVHEGQKSGIRISRDNRNHVTVNGNTEPAVNPQRELEKTGLPTTGLAGRPLEDVNSRTLFVSNVHFGATKDSLSRHFNKFGEVLKVIIIMDVATGQPSGSAYVEFMRTESADNALSLNGTSFMSRLLKVVRRSAAQQESVAPSMTWPRVTRGVAPFSTARFPRAAFGRGALRGRGLLTKGGSRSFQWKRDSQPSPCETVPSPNARSLTYVRNDPKPLPNSGTA